MEAFWEKLQFWKKPKPLEVGVDYDVVDYGDDVYGIVLLKKFPQVVFCINEAKFVEDEPKLEFDFDILNPGEYDKESLEKDPELHKMIGDVIVSVILKETNEPTRNNYSKESDL